MIGKLIFWAVFLVAYTVQAITGFAGGLIANPVGIHLFGYDALLTISNFVGIFACGFVAISAWREIMWREVAKICVVMLVFMVVGYWIGHQLTVDWVLRVYGVFVLIVGIKNLFFDDTADLPEWALTLVLFMAGIIQGMFICGGALLVIYALQKFRDKQNFRATMSAVWTVLNLVYFAFLALNGSCTQEVVEVAVVCIPLSFITAYVGAKIAGKINQQAFLKFVYVLLILIGISTLITA